MRASSSAINLSRSPIVLVVDGDDGTVVASVVGVGATSTDFTFSAAFFALSDLISANFFSNANFSASAAFAASSTF